MTYVLDIQIAEKSVEKLPMCTEGEPKRRLNKEDQRGSHVSSDPTPGNPARQAPSLLGDKTFSLQSRKQFKPEDLWPLGYSTKLESRGRWGN